ncbi:hypothetical protein KEJ32_05355 [Candidatus Bathyarchaeota archaeon]|nr:hypothetical protein [Candidatus Bathyarchaeota archaeon]
MFRIILSRDFALQAVLASTIIFMSLNSIFPLDSPLQTETTEYPFKLTIALEKYIYKLGERVDVTWILTNIGEENVTLYSSRDLVPDFIILDENLNHVFRYRSYMVEPLVILPYLSIAPRENITLVGTWQQIYDDLEIDFGVYPWVIKLKQVPPGTYYVFGIFESPTYGYIKLKTPLLRITIIG